MRSHSNTLKFCEWNPVMYPNKMLGADFAILLKFPFLI